MVSRLPSCVSKDGSINFTEEICASCETPCTGRRGQGSFPFVFVFRATTGWMGLFGSKQAEPEGRLPFARPRQQPEWQHRFVGFGAGITAEEFQKLEAQARTGAGDADAAASSSAAAAAKQMLCVPSLLQLCLTYVAEHLEEYEREQFLCIPPDLQDIVITILDERHMLTLPKVPLLSHGGGVCFGSFARWL